MLLCCQYFGNLVTCLDWDEAWLNEAFALYYQYKSVDVAEPGMRYVSSSQLSTAYSHRIDCLRDKREKRPIAVFAHLLFYSFSL